MSRKLLWGLKALAILILIHAGDRASLADEVESKEAFPPIEAQAFAVTIEKKSTTGRVLLLQSDGQVPLEGQLVLLKDPESRRVALRTRKLFTDQRFAAQIVREYEPGPTLAIGDRLQAIIKLRDLDLEEPKVTAVPPDDLDLILDQRRNILSPDEELELKSLAVDEIEERERERSGLFYRLAAIRLPGFEQGGLYSLGSGIRFSKTIAYPLFFYSSGMQDSAALDATVLFTALSGYTPAQDDNDAFSLLPLNVAAKYTLYPTDGFGVFGYLGLTKTLIIASKGEEPEYSEAITRLSFMQPAFGVGASIEIGPQWWAQLELGTDQIGLNLGIKF
jgi:hypothetical protein